MSLSSQQLPDLDTTASDKLTQQHNTHQSTEALKDITFGSIAGICGKFFEYPFDTVKVRLQSQPSLADPLSHTGANITSGNGVHYAGPLDCFRKSLASGGIRSLYRGISAPLFGAAVETSSLFFSYRIAQEVICAIAYPDAKISLDNESGTRKLTLPLSALIFCGAASGAFTSLLLTPIELVKCQMQAGASASPTAQSSVTHTHKNPLSVIASVWRNQGLAGFWRGQMGTLIRETGGSAAWFGSYEGTGAFLKDWSRDKASPHGVPTETPVWHQLLAGAVAGVSYNFLFYPADTIKSRMQTEAVVDIGGVSSDSHSRLRPPKANFFSVGCELWREQGLKGMYRGCGITVARSAPASAIIFAIFEGLRHRFG